MLKAVKVSLIGNIILFTVKAVTLIVVNSLAVATDLGISLVALIVSILLYYSVRLANRPADFVHNYGYGKVEHVCEAMEGIIIIGIAFAMSFQALASLVHPGHVSSPFIGFATSAFGILINVSGGIYIWSMARRSASPAIRAEAIHYFLEAFVSASITASFVAIMVLRRSGHGAVSAYIDPATALFVSVVIAIPSLKLAREAFFKLIDSSIEEPGKMEVLKCLAEHMDKYCEFDAIKTRHAGRKKFIELKVILPKDLSFEEGHAVARFIEEKVASGISQSEVSVRMEPCRADCVIIKNGRPCPYMPHRR